jgi:hypothetical protein
VRGCHKDGHRRATRELLRDEGGTGGSGPNQGETLNPYSAVVTGGRATRTHDAHKNIHTSHAQPCTHSRVATCRAGGEGCRGNRVSEAPLGQMVQILRPGGAKLGCGVTGASACAHVHQCPLPPREARGGVGHPSPIHPPTRRTPPTSLMPWPALVCASSPWRMMLCPPIDACVHACGLRGWVGVRVGGCEGGCARGGTQGWPWRAGWGWGA